MKVAVVDDNAVVRRGMVSMLDLVEDVDEVVTATDGVEAVELVEAGGLDLLFLDVRMPRLDGLGVLERVGDRVPCVMLTHSDGGDVVRAALARGARGYLVHGSFDVDELSAAVRSCATGALLLGDGAVAALSRPDAVTGGPPPHLLSRLTEREREIMAVVAEGAGNAEVAGRLFLSEKTVKNHLNRVYPKLEVPTRARAIAVWLGRAGAPGPAGGERTA